MTTTVRISTEGIGLDALRRPFAGPVQVELDDDVLTRVDRGRQVIDTAIARGDTIYGVNTGFGKLADRKISPDDLLELQRRLIMSHMTGVGEMLPDDVVRAMLLVKLACLVQGHSGVRREIVLSLQALLNADVLPCVPAQGSVGASGDLAPLSHMAAVLTGEGRVRVHGRETDAAEGLRIAGVDPVVLGPKEGVALINGTQASTALALRALFAAEAVFNAAVAAGALSLEAVAGRPAALDPRIQRIRRQPGQIRVAAALGRLVGGSPILAKEFPGRRLQDPYCMRCQPQVMGAAFDLLQFAATTLLNEANSVSDNPLIFPDDEEILSGGNFHGQPVAYAADIIALALCEVGSLSERRTAMLNDASMSGLPPFLVKDAGLNCGYQLAQVTSAALVAENRALATPNSVDSIPTSAGQEDHVSMATHAARRVHRMATNASYVVAIELLCAAQGVDLRADGQVAAGTRPVYDLVRARAPYLDIDRVLAPEIEAVQDLVLDGAFLVHGDVRYAETEPAQ
ncbi:histidine ammonia-lyase [Microbispora sp. NPDC046933]|uniref:histidine ammonia-lyase n=1 Tax=Microbispora sp. NPDC046933 TaxID=3155618 RepID=UPI0033D426A1